MTVNSAISNVARGESGLHCYLRLVPANTDASFTTILLDSLHTYITLYLQQQKQEDTNPHFTDHFIHHTSKLSSSSRNVDRLAEVAL
jgi:adenosyl cobinamide kinase/adenosyl cobinamide phosphate guanylyltransferase